MSPTASLPRTTVPPSSCTSARAASMSATSTVTTGEAMSGWRENIPR